MIKEFINHYQVKALRQASRRMRRQPTKSEDLLWQALRKRQLAGLNPADGGGYFGANTPSAPAS